MSVQILLTKVDSQFCFEAYYTKLSSGLTGLTVGMMGEGLQTGLIALIPHKAAVLFLLSSMLIDVPKGPRTALV